jgi:hypothetical protein
LASGRRGCEAFVKGCARRGALLQGVLVNVHAGGLC